MDIFSDASKQAYGTVAYCRFLTQSGDYKISVIASKCKVAPMKQITIPRIELCAAVAYIQYKSLSSEWCWIKSEIKPADMLTLPTNIVNMDSDSGLIDHNFYIVILIHGLYFKLRT